MQPTTHTGKTTPPAGASSAPILPTAIDQLTAAGYYHAAAAAAVATGQIEQDEQADFEAYLREAGPDALLINHYR